MAARAPKLSADDLRAELKRFHAEPHRTLHTAFFGTGAAAHLKVMLPGEEKTFRVAPVDCELRLREELSKNSDDEPLVLLVDYTERLPIDVEGRLARGGLIHISRERRLANLFGAKAVSAALLDGPLADALLRDGRPFPARMEGSTLDVHTAWRSYLERLTGLPSGDNLTEALVVEHFATPGSNPSAAGELGADPRLRDAARDYVRRTVGPIGDLAFGAWLTGRGLAVAALSFVIDPLAEHMNDGYVLAFLEGQLAETSKGPAPERPLLERWKALVPALALRLANRAELFDRVLADADARVRDKPKLERFLAQSRYLPSGLQAAKVELARALEALVGKAGSAGRGALSLDDVEAVMSAHKRISGHRSAESPSEQALNERLTMTVRLLAYLFGSAEREAKLDAITTPIELARELADHYATEGGFVDYARRSARAGVSNDALGTAISHVLAVVDAVRDAQDTRFGPALKRWNEDRKPGHLTPIEHVLDALGVELLNKCPESKLLILVMDGMAWHAAVEILLDLRDAHYGPLRFQPKHTASTKMPAPMIAALPTMTEVSRAALFAGKLLRVGEKTNTMKDPDRLLEHRGFVKVLGQGPRLLLRTEAEDNSGHLTAEARKLVQSRDRVVALVVNTVDDMLSAKPSYRAQYNRQTIKALGPLLEEARTAQRAVLLVADHGHVQSDRERQIVKVEGAESPRFREIGEKTLVSDRELVLIDSNTYRQRAGDRVALLYRETERYRDAHNLGEHGGASLSEVVTPALLIGADDLYQTVGMDEESNEALQTIAWPVPGWWELELPASSKQATKASVRPVRAEEPARKPKVSENQLTIFTPPVPEISAPAAPSRATHAEASEWSRRIEAMYERESKARREELKQKVLPVLDLLLDHGGRMSDEVLAGKLGLAQRNIGGIVAIMGEFLNVDGYDVVRYSVTQRLVELDTTMLAELFGEGS